MLCLAATHKSIYGKHCSRYLIQQISLSGLVVCYQSSTEGAALAQSAGWDVFRMYWRLERCDALCVVHKDADVGRSV